MVSRMSGSAGAPDPSVYLWPICRPPVTRQPTLAEIGPKKCHDEDCLRSDGKATRYQLTLLLRACLGGEAEWHRVAGPNPVSLDAIDMLAVRLDTERSPPMTRHCPSQTTYQSEAP